MEKYFHILDIFPQFLQIIFQKKYVILHYAKSFQRITNLSTSIAHVLTDFLSLCSSCIVWEPFNQLAPHYPAQIKSKPKNQFGSNKTNWNKTEKSNTTYSEQNNYNKTKRIQVQICVLLWTLWTLKSWLWFQIWPL